jgi:uncharacterized protein
MFKILLQLFIMITSVSEVPNPRHNNEWVSDPVNMIPAETEARMNATISRLNRELGVEIAVVTVDDVSTPKEFATSLFNHWGIGNASTDNGLLILMVRDKRHLTIETGYGLEAILPDSWLGTMQLTDMVPSFKRGDFGDGLEIGLTAIDERLRRNASDLPTSNSPRTFTSNNGPRHSSKLWTFLLLGFAVGVLLIIIWFVRQHKQKCQTCKIPMRLLSESEEDTHLNKKQQHEEEIRSVLYDVYHCSRCGSSKIVDKEISFSGFSRCVSCDTKAMTSGSKTITPATYKSGGLIEIFQRCSHCGFNQTNTQSTPMLVESTISSNDYSSASSDYSSASSDYSSASSDYSSTSSNSSSASSDSSSASSDYSSASSDYSSTSSDSSSFGGGDSGGGGSDSSW